MSTEEIVCILALGAMFIAMSTRRVSPTVGVVAALLVLYVTGVVGAEGAFAGFSNQAPLAIAGLYVVAGAVDRTAALQPLLAPVLGGGSYQAVTRRLVLAVGPASAFVANTPIVAMLISPVVSWADKYRQAPSKLLIPLSFASMLGGMLTTIGTSTNLVASGLADRGGVGAFSLFDPARIGLPVAVLGLGLVAVLGPRLLPERGELRGGEIARPFTISLMVSGGGALDGSEVAEGGLRNLQGVYLVAVERGDELIAPVAPGIVLRADDELIFAGDVRKILDLERMPGLQLSEVSNIEKLGENQHAWYEVVVGGGSPLIGRTVKEANFRRRYLAAVIALHRSGVEVAGKLGDERLQVGDSLLLVADAEFKARWRDRADFLIIQKRDEPPPQATKRAPRALAILVGVVIFAAFSGDILRAAVLGAVATVVAGVLTPRQARDSVDLNVVILIGAAIGVGGAVQSTGLAARMADSLVGTFGSVGIWGAALGLVVAAIILTELVTNAAAVALLIPVAIDVADQLSADPRLFALGVTVASSASFLTPVGYQTNTMVYGPGRYHFGDYARLGVPLTLVTLVVVPPLMAGVLQLW